MGEAKSNYRVLLILLAAGAVICMLLSAFLKDPALRWVFKLMAGALSIALVVQVVLFYIKPEAFRNKIH